MVVFEVYSFILGLVKSRCRFTFYVRSHPKSELLCLTFIRIRIAPPPLQPLPGAFTPQLLGLIVVMCFTSPNT
jgi:hypothetical protein